MLQYKVFANNDEFVAWQAENPGAAIFQMAPVAGNFGMQITETTSEGSLTFGLFAVFDLDPPPRSMVSMD